MFNKWIITQGTGTPCFLRMLTTVLLSYLKTNFRLICLQTSLTFISLCQKCLDPSIFYFLIETDDRNELLCSLLFREM